MPADKLSSCVCVCVFMQLYAIMCRMHKSGWKQGPRIHFRAAPITRKLFSQILHGRCWPQPCLWAAGMEWHVGEFGPFSEQLAVLVLNSLRCLCGKCISEYQSGCRRVVNLLIVFSHWRGQVVGEILSVFRALTFVRALRSISFHRCDVWLYVGLLGHNQSSQTVELCGRLVPLTLKKSPNSYFSFRNHGLSF